MTDSTTVSTWIDGYRRAWDSNAPDDIRALFTENAEYRTAPFVDPRVGQDAIVGVVVAGQFGVQCRDLRAQVPDRRGQRHWLTALRWIARSLRITGFAPRPK